MEMLEKLRKAFRERDLPVLKKISNDAIETAAMTEDPGLVSLSLIAYALYKILSKPHFLDSERWAWFALEIDNHLADAQAKKAGFEEEIIKDIMRFDESVGNYAFDIISQARIKQASRIYAMGLSMDKAIGLTGADRFEVLSYVGRTKIHDRPFTSNKSVVDRYKKLRELMEE